MNPLDQKELRKNMILMMKEIKWMPPKGEHVNEKMWWDGRKYVDWKELYTEFERRRKNEPT